MGAFFSDKEFPSISLLFKWQKEGEEEGLSYTATVQEYMSSTSPFQALIMKR